MTSMRLLFTPVYYTAHAGQEVGKKACHVDCKLIRVKQTRVSPRRWSPVGCRIPASNALCNLTPCRCAQACHLPCIRSHTAPSTFIYLGRHIHLPRKTEIVAFPRDNCPDSSETFKPAAFQYTTVWDLGFRLG